MGRTAPGLDGKPRASFPCRPRPAAAFPPRVTPSPSQVFAPVVHRSVTHTCHRIFHPAKPGHESPLIARQGQRPALYRAQAAAIDRWLAARGIAPQAPMVQGFKGGAGGGAGGGAASPRGGSAAHAPAVVSVAVTAGGPAL
jgi:hypothetical protein